MPTMVGGRLSDPAAVTQRACLVLHKNSPSRNYRAAHVRATNLAMPGRWPNLAIGRNSASSELLNLQTKLLDLQTGARLSLPPWVVGTPTIER
jgi:hypothetical protein